MDSLFQPKLARWGEQMSPITCGRCGCINPSPTHYRGPECYARCFIRAKERRDFVRIPGRRLMRAFRKAGAPVVHGPTTVTRTGNWIPRKYLDALNENRNDPGFRRLPLHLQVAAVVWWLKRGRAA